MLTVVVGLLVWLVGQRAWVLRRDWSGSRRWAGATLAIALVALGLAAAAEITHQWVQAKASALVAHASGTPGAVAHCQRFTPDLLDLSQYSGFVSWDDQGVARLRRTVCNDLAAWLLGSKSSPSADQVRAVHIVVHESMHVAGNFDEASAECAAMQLDTDAATFLGASPAQAHALTQAYFVDTYPYLRDGYVSAGCAADGALDLSPGDGQFP